MLSKRHGVLAYVLITFAVTWSGMFAIHYLLDVSLANPLAQLPWAIGPALVAVVVRKWITREGFGDAALALRLRTAWREYLVAWLGPLGLVVATCLLTAALGLWRPDLGALDDLVPGLPWWATVLVLLGIVVILTPIYWGEEFGWTGYLRMRLLPDRPLLATVATGLIWAVWHYPLAFLGYAEFDNVALGLLVWTVFFLQQEILLTWLRLRSGTIWTPSLAHAGNNLIFALLTAILLTRGEGGELEPLLVTLLTMVPMVPLCAWVLLTGRYRQEQPPVRAAAELALASR